MELVKPITSDHDLIELAKRIGVHLDDIFESNEITKPLPKKGSYLVLLRPPNHDVGHWQAVRDGEFFDLMGEAAPTNDVPVAKLTKALKTGKLSLIAHQLKGSGSVIHLHLASYEKALKARKAGRGVRLDITRHENKKGYKKLQGGSIWRKIKSGLSTAFKFVKDSGLLSKGLDAAVPALASAFGAPQAAIAARAAIKSLTGVGLYDSDSDIEKEGGRVSIADVKKAAKMLSGMLNVRGF
ncbi:unnamed protein product [Phytophthora lilii]|uniref:Unnamed protein product n=1 Tax=Phytophthora lilii TaxID=2077276 RepID=A0A9W6WRI0_9STRA|nr:unnamed protein product [Phytophthora lilii]